MLMSHSTQTKRMLGGEMGYPSSLHSERSWIVPSYKKTSLDQTTRRRDDETRRRDETARRDGETTRRPYRGGPKSIPYFSNFWTPFFGTLSGPVQETTRRQDDPPPPETLLFVSSRRLFVSPSLRLVVSSSRHLFVSSSLRLFK